MWAAALAKGVTLRRLTRSPLSGPGLVGSAVAPPARKRPPTRALSPWSDKSGRPSRAPDHSRETDAVQPILSSGGVASGC